MIRKNLTFTSRHVDMLAKEAKRQGISVSEVLRQMVDKYLAPKVGAREMRESRQKGEQ